MDKIYNYEEVREKLNCLHYIASNTSANDYNNMPVEIKECIEKIYNYVKGK